jgi:DNA polymerase epsilon subunit 3
MTEEDPVSVEDTNKPLSSSKSSPTKTSQQDSSAPGGSSIEDFDVPKSHITKVLKNALPDGTSIQKDARLAFMKATTVFINYITATANDYVRQANLKTITPETIIKALETSDMESFVPRVREALGGT